jgi:hypothetical protein
MDYVDEVGKLAALKDKGVLTREEFDRKKTELLSRGHSAAPAAQADPLGRGSGAWLDLAQKLLIEQRVATERPSQAVAYLLWLFTWMLGGHRFYLGRSDSARYARAEHHCRGAGDLHTLGVHRPVPHPGYGARQDRRDTRSLDGTRAMKTLRSRGSYPLATSPWSNTPSHMRRAFAWRPEEASRIGRAP